MKRDFASFFYFGFVIWTKNLGINNFSAEVSEALWKAWENTP